MTDSATMEERTVHVALRRAALGTPRQLPLQSSPLPRDSPLDQPVQQRIKDEVLCILAEHCICAATLLNAGSRHAANSIDGTWVDPGNEGTEEKTREKDYSCILIVERQQVNRSAAGRPTILVEADWDEPTSATTWPEVILHIQSALRDLRNPVVAALDLDIEIIASPQTCEIKVDRELFKSFHKLFFAKPEAEFVRILEDTPIIGNSLESWGPVPVTTVSHLKPWSVNVTVGVYDGKKADWSPVAEVLERYLRRSVPGINVKVSFHKCGWWFCID